MKNKMVLPIVVVLGLALLTRRKTTKEPIINNLVDSLPHHATKVYSTRDLNDINKIILHHYASNGTPQAIANYHVNTRDWAGIGYHFTIDKDGTISQVNYLDTVSYHTSGENTVSIGIALEGNFQNENPTQAQMNSLNKLIPFLRSKFPQQLEVYQHSDFANKPYDASINLTPYKLASLNGVYSENSNGYRLCNDGMFSDNYNGGSCSHHGGLFEPSENVTTADVEQYFFKDFIIIDFLQSHKINIDSFLEYSNRDYLKTRLNFLSKKGSQLDDVAQQLEMRYGVDFEPQEIVNIIESYPSPSSAMKDLKERTFEFINYGVGEIETGELLGDFEL